MTLTLSNIPCIAQRILRSRDHFHPTAFSKTATTPTTLHLEQTHLVLNSQIQTPVIRWQHLKNNNKNNTTTNNNDTDIDVISKIPCIGLRVPRSSDRRLAFAKFLPPRTRPFSAV